MFINNVPLLVTLVQWTKFTTIENLPNHRTVNLPVHALPVRHHTVNPPSVILAFGVLPLT